MDRGRLASGRRSGFSLVELMFVVLIISIVATVALPTFLGSTYTDRLVQATGEIQQAFEKARARALLRNAAVRIRIDRNPSDATANVRIDESPDAACSGFQRIAVRTSPPPDPPEADPYAACDRWLDTEQHRCALQEVHISGSLAREAYRETGITILSIDEGAAGGTWTGHESLVVCVNRRGRLLRWSDIGGWVPVRGGLRFLLDRREGRSGPFLGLTKEVYVPQGGIPGVLR